jgi:hypothetical protein
MKKIDTHIRLFKNILPEYYGLGFVTQRGIIIKSEKKDYIGHTFNCDTYDYVDDHIKIDVYIDNDEIFLTKDNFLVFKRGMNVIDVDNQTIYECDVIEKDRLLENLSTRQSIIISNRKRL